MDKQVVLELRDMLRCTVVLTVSASQVALRSVHDEAPGTKYRINVFWLACPRESSLYRNLVDTLLIAPCSSSLF